MSENDRAERHSSGSSTTIAEGDHERIRRRRSDELGEPSDKRYKRAGMAGVLASGAGGAGATALAQSGDSEPHGWRDVQVDDKHHIWSGKVSGSRKSALKKALLLFGFITVWLWICLPIFWGSNYKLTQYFHNLEVHLVSFDTSTEAYLNQPMTEMANMQASLPASQTHLGWSVRPSSDYPDGLDDVRANVLSQRSWATVVINANATSAWTNAIQNGDASYDPSGAITVYLQSARFYQVTLLYIIQLVSSNLETPLSEARSAALQDLAGQVGNGLTLANLQQVPQAVGVGFGYTINDLRPIGDYEWAGAAPMEAALIYYIIFAFYVCLFGAVARMKSGLGSRLQFRSMIALRLGWPILTYFFISLWFTLIERAFQIPVSSFMGSGGFPTLWALNFVTIIAAGFALETVLAIVGITWLPFFLILWIILNITSSFYPIEMMPRFYRFLRWTPFLHNVEGFKIIAYGTDLQHRLGKHFGILFGLIGVELICFPLSLVFERWSQDRNARREQAKKEEEDE